MKELKIKKARKALANMNYTKWTELTSALAVRYDNTPNSNGYSELDYAMIALEFTEHEPDLDAILEVSSK